MARTRYIKPGFFQNDRLAELGPWHRLLFAGLWTIADRAGRLEDRPKRIKGELFPYDDVDVDAMLTDLAKGDDPFVVRYEAGGVRCLCLPKWSRHQKPHSNEAPSVLPLYRNSRNTEEKSELAPNQEVVTTKDRAEVPDPHLDSDLDENSNENSNSNGESNGDGEPALPAPAADDAELLADAWNELTSKPIPACRELTDKRKRAARARLKERPLDEWRAIIARIAKSAFCRGETDRGDWVASFDFLLQPDTAVKVLEGKYDNRGGGTAKPLLSAPEIRQIARSLGSSSWAAECVREHDGRCGGPNAHADRMADQIGSFLDGGKRVAS